MPPNTCQELRCSQPAVDPFTVDADPPITYWLCTAHREQVRHDRWSAQTQGVLLVGDDAILDSPKTLKWFSAQASDLADHREDGSRHALVELKMTIGYLEGTEHDSDLTILIPAHMADVLGTALPGLAADAKRALGQDDASD